MTDSVHLLRKQKHLLVCHELRTHMAAIIGLLDILMSDDCLTNEQCATVTHIRKCLTVLFRLLNNILDLSKVESGKLILEDAEFNLGRELEGLVDMFSVQSMNHSLETVLDLSVKCDSMKAENEATVAQDMKKELQEFKLQYKKLKVILKFLNMCLMDFSSSDCFFPFFIFPLHRLNMLHFMILLIK
ncbi:hypothetical protein HN51_053140 [Arachis hypogaea]